MLHQTCGAAVPQFFKFFLTDVLPAGWLVPGGGIEPPQSFRTCGF